jgi:putative (di)nucleoside polyphosphate hydrolase
MRDDFFRANVGIVVTNNNQQVLALERSDHPGSWQLPQGGIKFDELPAKAALRELWEETAILSDSLEFIQEAKEWLVYELPENLRSAKTGRGQAQKWFHFQLIPPHDSIHLEQAVDQEFSAWRWVFLRELIKTTISFRRDIYRKIEVEFKL